MCFRLQPPLPEEDYPPADPPEAYEDVSAASPPALHKEFTLSHVSRTVIPRANLDRSTPAGWSLTVEHNGTWVFTSENSPDQVRWFQETEAVVPHRAAGFRFPFCSR